MHSPFDILARTYDTDFIESTIGKLQRQQVWELLEPLLSTYRRSIRVLEINCGTGEDALRLAALGHSVVATDASEMMIEKANQKAAFSKGDVTFQVCSFNNLHIPFNNERFDLVISNFGGLNCIDENALAKLGTQLSSMLKHNGKLFFVVMSRSCLWEIVYFSAKGKPGTAFRRQKGSVNFNAGGVSMPVHYYSPRGLKRIFKQYYTCLRSRPVGLFIPPSYMDKWFLSRPYFLSRLAGIDRRWNNCGVLSNLADHFCIILQKNDS